MQEFKIPIIWQMSGEYTVMANTLAEAMRMCDEMPLPEEGDYLEHKFDTVGISENNDIPLSDVEETERTLWELNLNTMQKDKEATTVIFRRFKDGEVIALFPYQIEDHKGNVLSYMHTGQHSAASLDIIQYTVLAQPSEYADIQKELEGIGYLLDIRKRVNWKRWNKARKAI